jgi:hypothetical protein
MNEPVAWYYPGGSPDQCTTNKEYAEMEPAWTPLYTHPEKELTDEEILNIAHQIRLIDRQTVDDGHLYFAKAILRKAQEKCTK